MYGFPSPFTVLKSQREYSPEKIFNKTLMFDEPPIPKDHNNRESAYNSMELGSLLNEDLFSKKVEFSYEEESILKYVLNSKEIINSINLP